MAGCTIGRRIHASRKCYAYSSHTDLSWNIILARIRNSAYHWHFSGMYNKWIGKSATIRFWCVKFSYWLHTSSHYLKGVLYPSLHSLILKWAPPSERGRFISALLGGTFGTVVTWPLAGILQVFNVFVSTILISTRVWTNSNKFFPLHNIYPIIQEF